MGKKKTVYIRLPPDVTAEVVVGLVETFAAEGFILVFQ